MQKVIMCALFIYLVSSTAYPFWMWSPKTKKWSNPTSSALPTPQLQLKEAMEYFNDQDYKNALREFKKIIIHYPDAKEAAEAQYYLGRCLEVMNQPYPAFLEYKKVLESYPNSQRINEILELQYKIGEAFLKQESKRWLGMSKYDFVEHPSIEIFKTIVEKGPYSKYAPQAQYQLGVLFLQLARFEEAKDAFQNVVDNYPENEFANPAKYQLAIATARAFPGADYDAASLEEATKRMDAFVKKHPHLKITELATQQLGQLRDQEAKKQFAIAQFYEKQKKFSAAKIYYQEVVKNYPETEFANLAKTRIIELGE